MVIFIQNTNDMILVIEKKGKKPELRMFFVDNNLKKKQNKITR